MASNNAQAIRAALASRIQTQLSIPSYANMPAQVSPPMTAVLPGSPYIRYGATAGEQADALGAVMGGLAHPQSKNDLMLTVMVLISQASGYEAQQSALDTLLEPAGNTGSIPTAIAIDDTLGGMVDFCVPLEVSTYGVIEVAGQGYFGARIRMQVGA